MPEPNAIAGGGSPSQQLLPEDAWAVSTIWQEARGEPYEGKVAVAEVIRNRMKKKYFSDGTVSGTVLKPHQFSGWNTKDPNREPAAKINTADPIVQACLRAWKEANEQKTEHTRGATSYHAKGMKNYPSWALVYNKIAEVGNHLFYDEKKKWSK